MSTNEKATTFKAFAEAFADEDRDGRYKTVNKTIVMSCWTRPPTIILMRSIQHSGTCCNSIVIAEEKKSKADSANEKATPDLSLQGRAYDRERPMLEKTIAALLTMGIHFSYDLFRKRYRVGDYALKEQFGESIGNAILVLRTHITEKLGFDPRGHIEPAVFRLCLENAFNPVLDYLDGLKWDRVPRLDTWLMTYLGATEGVLNRVFGRKVLIAAVRRARKPGQ
jgi:hypothetical protein